MFSRNRSIFISPRGQPLDDYYPVAPYPILCIHVMSYTPATKYASVLFRKFYADIHADVLGVGGRQSTERGIRSITARLTGEIRSSSRVGWQADLALPAVRQGSTVGCARERGGRDLRDMREYPTCKE